MSNAMLKTVSVGRSARRHVWPPSVEIRKPLSLPSSMKWGFFGSIHIAWLSPPAPRPPPAGGGAPAAAARQVARHRHPAAAADAAERLAAVARDADAERERVDGVLVGRIDADVAEHPCVGIRHPFHERALLVVLPADQRPARALVVRSIDLVAFDRTSRRAAARIPAASARRGGLRVAVVVVDRTRTRRWDSMPRRRRRCGPITFDGGRPFVSRVHVLPASVVLKMPPSSKPGFDARVVPLAPLPLPRRGVERVRILRIHREIVRRRSSG